MSKPTHPKLIRKKRKRKEKLAKLREKYLKAKTKEEKQAILEKMKKITPWLSEEEFLTPINR